MLRRWTPDEDRQIDTQLKHGVAIGQIVVADRKKGDIRKRAYRIGLLEKHRPTTERQTAQWKAVEECLKGGDKTLKQLSAASGLTQDVVRGVLRRNRRIVHISGRTVESPFGRRYAMVWALGAGEDASEFDKSDGRPAVFFDSRRDPEAAMIAEARERLREVEARGDLIRRDPYVTALFGQYRPQPQAKLAARS